MTGWRDKYKVHPATDLFPMMSDAELEKLGEDIKMNGLADELVIWVPDTTHYYPQDISTFGSIVDGRNRLEAMERCGIDPTREGFKVVDGDPVAYVISKNLRRRHLTKQEQADLIVACHKAWQEEAARQKADEYIGRDGSIKPRQVGEVYKGGRGHVNELKAKVIASAKEHGIGTRTVERSLAKADGRWPQPTKLKLVITTRTEEPKPLIFRDTSRPVPVYEVEVDGARIRYVSLLAKLSPARRKSELAKFAAEIKALAKKEAK